MRCHKKMRAWVSMSEWGFEETCNGMAWSVGTVGRGFMEEEEGLAGPWRAVDQDCICLFLLFNK